jgi:hypothetical protein
MYCYNIWYYKAYPDDLVLPVLVLGFGLFGLIDDIYGNREAGGFSGHLSLLRKGKMSTGLLKAAVGGILGLFTGWIISGYHPVEAIINGLLICLAANTLNLLDLRPGRAVSCFWVGLAFVGMTAHLGALLWDNIIIIIIPAILLTILDRKAIVMLGDAGSNVLGVVLGVMMAYAFSLPVKLAVIAVFIGVNVYSEKYSISKLIESNRVLRRIDGLLGER